MPETYYLKLDEGKLDYYGTKRILSKSRLPKIKKYLNYDGSTFPNSIILNLDRKILLEESANFLEIKKSKDSFAVINGQHRLAGLKYSNVCF